MKYRVSGGARLLAFAVLLMFGVTARANAAPLNLITGEPDISAFFLNFTFDSNGGVCGAGSDYTLCYSADPAALSSLGLNPELTEPDSFVPYSLIASVDPVTGLLTALGGTFAIGDYLTGSVSQFGYAIDGGVAVLEFLIGVTGGSLAPQFGPTIGVIGAIYDWGTADFGTDAFTVSSADAITDNFAPIPEPATLLLLGLGLFGVSAVRQLQGKARH